MELLAEGRMAQVFVLDGERVVKLDRPEWSGVSEFEEGVLRLVADVGIPVPRPHGTVTIEDRCGLILDRIFGPSLTTVIDQAAAADLDVLARRFAAFHRDLNAATVSGLPDLIPRLRSEIAVSGLPETTTAELVDLLGTLDDQQRQLCHFDLHPDNVLVSPAGWVVIDWLGAASGPPAADFARTLILRGSRTTAPTIRFMVATRRCGQALRGLDDGTCTAWMRVLAAARLAEGLEDEHATWLRDVAVGKPV